MTAYEKLKEHRNRLDFTIKSMRALVVNSAANPKRMYRVDEVPGKGAKLIEVNHDPTMDIRIISNISKRYGYVEGKTLSTEAYDRILAIIDEELNRLLKEFQEANLKLEAVETLLTDQ